MVVGLVENLLQVVFDAGFTEDYRLLGKEI
jgi:hypothetical protein